MMNLKCLVVDDEPAGRKVLEELIEDVPFLQWIGSAENPVKALEYLESESVDLMFLDIRMPKMNGIAFLKSLRHPPVVIITSAHSEYAVEGFELDVMDYLLKPVSLERLVKAVTKARDFLRATNSAAETLTQPVDYFFVKCGNVYERIRFEDVLYIESLNNFVSIHTDQRQYVTWLTTKAIEDGLPAGKFLRIHRSYIVALARVEKVAGSDVYVGGKMLPISKALKAEVMDALLKNRLLQR